ncbi:Ig-like domain-containing protein [Salegentibacter chungangensis]|uniref:Ig-like domain-containing protein n=1 Tax=Salegentibacter chungangensis TaxID=1335724 RepID=A0ABW3NVU1_9FLAO
MGNRYNWSIPMFIKNKPAGVFLLVMVLFFFFPVKGLAQNGVEITSPEPDPTSADPIPINIKFEDGVDVLNVSDFQVTNGELQNLVREDPNYSLSDDVYDLKYFELRLGLFDFLDNKDRIGEFFKEQLGDAVVSISQLSDTEIIFLKFNNGVEILDLTDGSKNQVQGIDGSNMESPLDIEASLPTANQETYIADKDAQVIRVYDNNLLSSGTLQPLDSDASEDFGPTGVVTDEVGNLYTTIAYTGSSSQTSERVVVFDSNGNITYEFPPKNLAETLRSPYRLAVDKKERVYISDAGEDGKGRIQVYEFNGSSYTLIHSIKGEDDNIGSPGSIVVDDFGYIYVIDYEDDISFSGIFQNPMDFIESYDEISNKSYSINVYDSNNGFQYVTEFNGGLNLPIDLELDYCGNILVNNLELSGEGVETTYLEEYGTIPLSVNVNFNFQLKTFTRNDIFSAELVPQSEGLIEVDLQDADLFKCAPPANDHFEIVYEAASQNTAPEAQDDSYQTDQDQTLTKTAAEGVLVNDTDQDGDDLTAELIADVTDGTLTLNPDGSFEYIPDAGFTGTDEFTYVANDGQEDSNVATVTITVNAVEPENTAPVAQNDSYQTNQGQTLAKTVAEGVLVNDTDEDGDDLTAELIADVTDGTLTLNPDGSFEYIPDSGFTGTDEFTYVAKDGQKDSNVATVTITVNAVEPENTAPVAQDDSYQTNQDQTLTKNAAEGVLMNDTDQDGDDLTAELIADVTDGTLTLNPDGSFEYIPDAGFTGTDEFTYVANDGQEDSNVATVTITVNAVEPENTAPVAQNDSYQTNQDQTLTKNAAEGVLVNDTDQDGDDLTAELIADVTDGTLTLNPDGSFEYIPDSGFSGTDEFSYVANDGQEDSNGATVTITVTAEETGPEFQDCPVDMEMDNDPGECGATVNFEKPTATDENGEVEVIQTSGPASGSLFPVGETEIVFEARDGQANTEECRFTVTVVDNQGPVAVCQDKEVWLDENGELSVNASELDGGSYDNCGIAEIRLSQTEFTTDDIGENELTFSVADLAGQTTVCAVTLTVRAYDPDPEINCVEDYSLQLDENGEAVLNVSDLYTGNPGDAEFSLSKSSFDCSDLGENTVTLSYSGSNVGGSCEVKLIIEDNIDPVVNLKGAQLELDESGSARLTSAYVNAGSTDNCSTNLNFSFSKTNFSCEDVGSNQVEVTVTDESGNSTFSTTTVFVSPNPGVCDAEETEVEYVFLYPNPTKGEFSIAAPDDLTIYRVMIYDARGRFIKEVVFSGEETSYNLKLLNVRDAVYFLRLYTSEGRKTERLIINN